jgi:hypothetical protein
MRRSRAQGRARGECSFRVNGALRPRVLLPRGCGTLDCCAAHARKGREAGAGGPLEDTPASRKAAAHDPALYRADAQTVPSASWCHAAGYAAAETSSGRLRRDPARRAGIYRLRIAAAEDLLDEGARMVDETGRERIAGARLLLVVQATRAIHIFESVIALCRIGRGVPASMLNRALLEDALDVHWVAANPEVAPARADEHERLTELGERALDQRLGRPTDLASRLCACNESQSAPSQSRRPRSTLARGARARCARLLPDLPCIGRGIRLREGRPRGPLLLRELPRQDVYQ